MDWPVDTDGFQEGKVNWYQVENVLRAGRIKSCWGETAWYGREYEKVYEKWVDYVEENDAKRSNRKIVEKL